ncbi:MAG: ATP-binding protein [Solirubrobacteraceae bacterium]|nr:ATP-binding protein [Solirubrobacteraceae bacterium]
MRPSGEPDFKTLFEHAPACFMVLDADLKIIAFSDAYLEATRITRAEVGKFIFDVFPDNPDDDDATGVGNLSRSLERVKRDRVADTMAVQKYDIPVPDEPGAFEPRHWSCTNTPVLDAFGVVTAIIHRAEDVTAFVEHFGDADEQGLQDQAEILRRSADLGAANRQLEAAGQAKNAFLSHMSHELRTPLAAVLGFSELLTLAELEPAHHEWSVSILKAGRHLLDLVNEVLDISRLESGDLGISLEPIALDPIVADAYDLVGPLAASRGITLHTPQVSVGSGYIMADVQRLKQVLVNLLSNAVKYNRDGGDVHVTVEPLYPDRVGIEVTDTGPGISADKIQRLFRPFERLDAASTGVEGVGLGLALSRTLMENMGGELAARSVVGEGTTFTVMLQRGEPVAVQDGDADDREVLVPVEYDRPRSMLYIEDTVANVRLIEDILVSRPSVKLLPAMLGSLGIDLARENQPDLILLDLHLPDHDGDYVLEQLKADDRTRDIPVVMLSADATGQVAEPLIAAGAAKFLTKPIGVRELLAVVDEQIGGGPATDAARSASG